MTFIMKITNRLCRLLLLLDKSLRKKLQIKLSDFIFWIAFCLLLVIHCIENTSLTQLDIAWLPAVYLIRYILYLVLFFKIVMLSSYTTREVLAITIIFIIGCFNFLCTDDFGLFELFLVVTASKGASITMLITVFAYIKGIGTFLTLFLYAIGILPTLHYLDDIVGAYNTYGFSHRNVLGANMAILCMAWFYLRYKKLNQWDYLLWILLTAATYKLALSRSALILMIMILASFFLYRLLEPYLTRNKKQFFYFRKFLIACFFILLVVSILCTIFYQSDSTFWSTINRIFTKRIQFANQCLNDHGLSVFGKDLPFISSMEAQVSNKRKLILDNSYMRALLFYGIVPGSIYLYTCYCAIRNAVRRKQSALFLCLTLFFIYGFSERYMLDINYNFPLLIACQSFFYKPRRGTPQRRTTLLTFAYRFTARRLK